MNDFEKYFLKPKSRGFKKNLLTWKNECIDYNNFEGDENNEEIYKFYHPTEGQCQHPECNKKTKFISLGRGFKETCCRKHSMELTSLRKYGVKYKSQLPEFREAVKKTNLEKYGSENVFASETIKDKIKKSNLEKYGVENPMHNKAIVDKMIKSNINNNGGIGFQTNKAKDTMQEKYGASNPSQIKEFQNKKKQTFIDNYGVDNPMKSKLIQDKVRATNLEKYGVENTFSSETIKGKIKKSNLEKYGYENAASNPEIRKRIVKTMTDTMFNKYGDHIFKCDWFKDQSKKTCLEKYGVSHPMQVTEIFEKNLNSAYRRKEYIWKTGESSFVQGYEPIVLKELEDNGYTYNQVKTNQDDMPEIWYEFENKKCRYFPDFFIPEENLIIEVKSEFTLEKGLDRNNAKFNRVKELGFEFRLEVR